ncbi:MAG: prealbumin-like fold domain-containing protein [Defluviitaleaceae bacterium]|nr:prealbumin-like fold domain-containing protein [Defluviitaleaceae bacterium]
MTIHDNTWFNWATSYNLDASGGPCPQPPKPRKTKFIFHVINPEGEGVAGVEFTLYRLEGTAIDDPSIQVKAVAVSDNDGIVDFGCIPMQNFFMRETSRPEGYRENNHIYRVSSNNDGITIDCQTRPDGGHTIVLLQYSNCSPVVPEPVPRSSHNTPIRNPHQIFNSINASGDKHTMKGNDRLPRDFDSPILAGGGWFCHVQGFGKYGSNLIVSHNSDKNRRFGYFVVSEEGKILGHHYDAHYELTGDTRNFNHTGGFQIIGDYLAMGIETPDYNNSIVALYDLKNINPACEETSAGPQFKRLLRGVKNNNCAALGISNFKIMQNGAELPYFLMVTHENGNLVMYIAQSNDLLTANFHQVYIHQHNVKDYQGLTLLTEDIDSGHDYANFYLVAPFTTDNFLGIPTNDYCDLWKINISGNLQANPAFVPEKIVDGRHFYTHGGTVGIKVHFRWGSSVEILNSDSFRLHTTERNFATVSNFELVYNTFKK